MKNEDFDEAIRNKLDGLGQTYTDGDIDNVFHHVKKHNGFAWKGIRSSWLLYSLSAAAFVGLVIWQVNRISPKQNTIVNTINTVAKIQEVTTSVAYDTTNTTHKKNISSLESTIIKAQKPIISSAPIYKAKLQNNTVSSDANVQIAELNYSDVSQKKPVPVLYKPETIFLSDSNSKVELHEKTDLRNSNSLAENGLNDMTAVDNTLLPDTNTSVKSDSHSFEKQRASKWNLIKLQSVSDFRIKSGVALSKYSIAPGIAADVLLKNNFGFSIGLQYDIAAIERFNDKKDLDKKRPHGMDHPFSHHISDKDHVVDIQISSRIIQLPVSVSYYFPVKKYFRSNVSLGTNMDLFLHQDFKFKSRGIDTLDFEPRVFSASDKVTPFNNIVISVGAEKSWRLFTIRIEPFIAPKISKVIYKPREMDYGFGINLFYSFKKK